MREDNHIFWRDEILQLLFWMLGEGMGESHPGIAIARYLDVDPSTVGTHLDQMVAAGYLSEQGGRFSLTELGRAEGGRRFKDEFESILSQGHGECSDPNCDCHELGAEHCKSHSGPVN
jgi:Predicted transcriptional regulator